MNTFAYYAAIALACAGAVVATVINPMATGTIAILAIACWLIKSLGDWWRRSYFITLLFMASGVTHIESILRIASVGKFAALGLLLLITLFTTRGLICFHVRGFQVLFRTLWGVVVLAIASTIWSYSPTDTIIKAFTLAALVVIIQRVGSTRWQDRRKLIGDVGATYVATLIPILAGLAMQIAGMAEAAPWQGRHQGFFNNPNMLGLTAMLSFAFGLALAMEKKKLLIWISLTAPLIAIILTGSRTPVVAIAIGMLWILIRGSVTRAIVGGIATAVIALCIVLSGNNPLRSTMERFSANEGGDLLNHRSAVWDQVLDFVIANPFGTGWGATFSSLESETMLGTNTSGLFSVHNSYYQMLYEIGWIAIPFSIMLIVIPIIATTTVKLTGLTAGLAVAVISGTVALFSESAIFGVGQPYPYIYWFAVVALLALGGYHETNRPSDSLLTARLASTDLRVRKVSS